MKILYIDIDSNVETIIQSEKEKYKFNLSVKPNCDKCATYKTSDHSYCINITSNATQDHYLHEYMHVILFENNYPMIHPNVSDVVICKLIDRINDMILDIFVNKYLYIHYNYIPFFAEKDYKYNKYKLKLKNVNSKNTTDNFFKLMAVEISYIYFNDSNNHANTLLKMIEKYSYNTSKYFYKIVDSIKQCKEYNRTECIKVYESIIEILDLVQQCDLEFPYTMSCSND